MLPDISNHFPIVGSPTSFVAIPVTDQSASHARSTILPHWHARKKRRLPNPHTSLLWGFPGELKILSFGSCSQITCDILTHPLSVRLQCSQSPIHKHSQSKLKPSLVESKMAGACMGTVFACCLTHQHVGKAMSQLESCSWHNACPCSPTGWHCDVMFLDALLCHSFILVTKPEGNGHISFCGARVVESFPRLHLHPHQHIPKLLSCTSSWPLLFSFV